MVEISGGILFSLILNRKINAINLMLNVLKFKRIRYEINERSFSVILLFPVSFIKSSFTAVCTCRTN